MPRQMSNLILIPLPATTGHFLPFLTLADLPYTTTFCKLWETFSRLPMPSAVPINKFPSNPSSASLSPNSFNLSRRPPIPGNSENHSRPLFVAWLFKRRTFCEPFAVKVKIKYGARRPKGDDHARHCLWRYYRHVL